MLISTRPIGPMSVEDLVFEKALMEVVAERVKSTGFDVPGTLTDRLRMLGAELDKRLEGERRREAALLKKQIASWTPRDEKLAAARARLAELDALLGETKPEEPKAND